VSWEYHRVLARGGLEKLVGKNSSLISVCRKVSNPWHRAPPQFTIEFRHSWYLETFEVYFHVQTASKNEAIQKHLLTCQIAIRFKIVRLLLLHWHSLTIIEEIHCHFDTVYNIQENLFIYHFSCIKSQFQLKSISRKIFSVIENSFIAYLKQQSLLETRLETINIEEWYYYYYSRWSWSTWVTW